MFCKGKRGFKNVQFLYIEKEGSLKPPEPIPWYAGTLYFVFVVHDICLKELHAFMFKVSSTLNS